MSVRGTTIQSRWLRLYFLLFPEIIMHNHTYRVRRFVAEVAAMLPPGSSVLDAGAGSCQYKPLFTHCQYVAQDIVPGEGIDIAGDMTALPVSAETFNAVLCIQVLEHTTDPSAVFRELYRVLRPGGRLFLTTHLVFAPHMEPWDYFRFTNHGLRHLAEAVGFRVVAIRPQGGIWVTLGKLIQIAPLELLSKHRFVRWSYYAIATIPLFLLNAIFLLLDHFDREKKVTLNYECVFEKDR